MRRRCSRRWSYAESGLLKKALNATKKSASAEISSRQNFPMTAAEKSEREYANGRRGAANPRSKHLSARLEGARKKCPQARARPNAIRRQFRCGYVSALPKCRRNFCRRKKNDLYRHGSRTASARSKSFQTGSSPFAMRAAANSSGVRLSSIRNCSPSLCKSAYPPGWVLLNALI